MSIISKIISASRQILPMAINTGKGNPRQNMNVMANNANKTLLPKNRSLMWLTRDFNLLDYFFYHIFHKQPLHFAFRG
jgi:hypothetical protein